MTLPEKIGGYRVLRELGEGGLATVYEVEDPRVFRAHRALKLLKKEVAIPTEHFLGEARVMASLSHPNLMPIHDFGRDEETGQLYMLLGIVGASSLDEARPLWRVEEDGSPGTGPVLGAEQIRRCFEDVLAGLAVLHARGLVHRDVKPRNIMLTPDGVAVLGDLGITQPAGQKPERVLGRIPGTPGYMAPELWRGEEATPASDLFSVGLSLYRTATGEHLYKGLVSSERSGEEIGIYLAELLDQGRELAPAFPAAVPPGLREVIRRAVRIRPEQRFSTAEQMLQALRSTRSVARPSGSQHLAAVIEADVVDYSARMQANAEAVVAAIESTREPVADCVTRHEGRVVDFVGDCFLAEFPSALAAARAATELQRLFAERNRGAPPEAELVWRVGVHLGDVQVEGNRLYGDGINVAARLEGLAEPGGICVSDDVYRQIRSRGEFAFVDLGEHEAKGSPEPVRVWRLDLAGTHSG